MKKRKAQLKELLIITVATIIIGGAVHYFLEPSTVSIGSISSLAIILSHFIPLPMSYITMVLNIILLVVGFLFIGRNFGAKTVYTSILLPLSIRFFETISPDQASIMGSPFQDMLVYVFLVNIGCALLFNHNASSGGLDIVAKLLNKFLHMDLGKATTAAGFVVASMSVLLYEPKIVILSLLGTYINGLILDHLIFGFDRKKRVCIISEKQEEIRSFLVDQLHSGATVYQVMGGFNAQSRLEIITIVDMHEYQKLMTFLEKTDPNAFITVYDVNKIIYTPKVIPEK